MIRSLRARVLAAFALLALAFFATVGGALFVVLRDLNQQSQEAALTEALVPFVVQVRLRLVAGTAPKQVVAALTPFTQGSGVSVFLTDDNGQVLDTGSINAPGQLIIPGPQRRGDVTNGTYRLDGQTYQYVAATLFADATPGGARALVLAHPDNATAQALGDLGRGLLVALLAVLIVGIPLATLLARQVFRPLER
ncbi:MAG TPA: hypothetical protein VN771_08440, partial [Candidatus Baltobacteraceae bacterium]|nr:hypothetical protein [Candidatus Baltobacteraceae bacterium]